MKHVVHKLMFNYEKEEKWINEMAAKGLNLVDYTVGRYLFEEGKPGEYIYRIELLRNYARSPEGMAYIRFMEEMGIECTATYNWWAFFRKKAADGPFELFSDYDSKIAHYNRTTTIICIVFVINAVAALINIMIPFLPHTGSASSFNFMVGCLNLVLAFILAPVYFSLRGKLRKLRADRLLRE